MSVSLPEHLQQLTNRMLRKKLFLVTMTAEVAADLLMCIMHIRRAFTKRFPLGQFSQTVTQAAVEARQLVKNPDEIQEINIWVSRSSIKLMADSPDKWRPQTHELQITVYRMPRLGADVRRDRT
jgi:2-methylcitrate dehydratase PrpD